MNSGNPVLNNNAFGATRTGGPAMTVSGSINKSLILLVLLIATACFSWSAGPTGAGPFVLVGALGGFVTALVTIFKKEWAPVTAPLYALLEGLFLGGISAIYNAKFNGVVAPAIMLTFGVLAAMLALYQLGIIRVTEKFRMGLFAATGGIALVYLVSMVLGLFHVQVPFLHGGGAMSIGFSLFVVVIAALNLVLDFDLIVSGAAMGAPRYMEWYAAFGLMVTLIWLYLEILRLLANMNRR